MEERCVTDWVQWHERYENPSGSLSRRLLVVQQRIGEFLDRCPSGPVRIIGMCTGDGRDLLGVLETHSRAADVVGRLVEIDETLAERARARAPSTIDVRCGDAGLTDAYVGAMPADLVLCCGVFGNITDEDVRATIAAWRSLSRVGGTVIWTRGGAPPDDPRPKVREWVRAAGCSEVSFDIEPQGFSVGVATMTGEMTPLEPGVRMFRFREVP